MRYITLTIFTGEDDKVFQRKFNIDHIILWGSCETNPQYCEVLVSCGVLYTVKHTEIQITNFIRGTEFVRKPTKLVGDLEAMKIKKEIGNATLSDMR
jgi:hypothetical protein